jgi:choice-of-anchor C domain-containing protein
MLTNKLAISNKFSEILEMTLIKFRLAWYVIEKCILGSRGIRLRLHLALAEERKVNPSVLVIAAFLSVVLIGPGKAKADLIVNGGFETPVLTPGQSQTLSAGDSSMAPWVLTAGSVDVVQNGYWPANQGNNSIDLNGVSPGTIQQTFATNPGVTYALTFAYACNADVVDVDHSLFTGIGHVTVSGASTLLDTTVSHSGSSRANMSYQIYSGNFVANSSSTTLQFQDASNAGTHGLVLDSVSVNSVPEPSTLALLAAVPLLRRRRRS